MTSEHAKTDWFAVQVRTRWEQSTAEILQGKGYEALLPLYQSQRPTAQKSKLIEAPLFPGYVFCRFDVFKRLPVLVTPGVISIVGRGRTPVPIESSEMAAIEKIVFAGAQAEPWPYLELGQRVRIESTSLRGLEGILVAFKGGSRVIVSVSLLQRSVAVELDPACLVPINEKSENQRELVLTPSR